ncbi:hypothetical protein DEO72_LG1g2631 [Vigna unguiculata]|uniref:Uncharacterized protein n=1 Tax=Vigna unguiculata TaxID=3917 RepID=A0A4D6KYM5_VIGUN|nr:hypothetical protein DEO72_LG1g2631 [Vigna unguiculata]
MVTDSSEWWWRCCCRLIAEKLAVVTVDLFELRRDGSKLTVREFQWIVKNVATKMMMVCENSGAARDLVHERLLQWWCVAGKMMVTVAPASDGERMVAGGCHID